MSQTGSIPSQAAFATPRLIVERSHDGIFVKASGVWLVHALAQPGTIERLRRESGGGSGPGAGASWDLSPVERLDHIGAQFFWSLWGKRRPTKLTLGPRQEEFFDRLFHLGNAHLPAPEKLSLAWIRALGASQFRLGDHLVSFVRVVGQLILDLGRLLRQPHKGPWREISANVYRAGAQALGITALVGFLIGIVLSYLSSQQLRVFGADVFIVNILGLAVIRELGPVLAAILVAGRSGSAITAQLGVMRVTEELDAMLVMGIPHGFRLILPRALGLALAMPLLVVWTDIMALLGGMSAAKLTLGMSFTYFVNALPAAVPLANMWLGVGKGAIFGILIALVACHFGMRIQPNTRSLGEGTTSAVVSAITVVIIADAIIAVLFKDVGF
jgi:phospholipid/cholesterol/gamma-HCH transport system permease protein